MASKNKCKKINRKMLAKNSVEKMVEKQQKW